MASNATINYRNLATGASESKNARVSDKLAIVEAQLEDRGANVADTLEDCICQTRASC